MTDAKKCENCIHLQAPEMRMQWHCLNGEVWTDVDIINRCELSGYPVGCVMADVKCRREELKQKAMQTGSCGENESLQSLAVVSVV